MSSPVPISVHYVTRFSRFYFIDKRLIRQVRFTDSDDDILCRVGRLNPCFCFVFYETEFKSTSKRHLIDLKLLFISKPPSPKNGSRDAPGVVCACASGVRRRECVYNLYVYLNNIYIIHVVASAVVSDDVQRKPLCARPCVGGLTLCSLSLPKFEGC